MKNKNDFTILLYNLIWLRERYGLSKKKMAELLGIGRGTWSKIERMEFPPMLSVQLLDNVYTHFGIPSSVLLSHRLDRAAGQKSSEE